MMMERKSNEHTRTRLACALPYDGKRGKKRQQLRFGTSKTGFLTYFAKALVVSGETKEVNKVSELLFSGLCFVALRMREKDGPKKKEQKKKRF